MFFAVFRAADVSRSEAWLSRGMVTRSPGVALRELDWMGPDELMQSTPIV